MLAGSAYLVTFVAAVFQIVTGFYMLYPESASWQALGYMMAGTQQNARFIHFLLMWYFLVFATVHIYMRSWNDITSGEGIISSIFNGYKFMRSRR